MGNIQSYQNSHFEDIQTFLGKQNNGKNILINTLPINMQHCLISNTIRAEKEEELINSLLRQDKTTHITIYGKNYRDPSIFKKYKQLKLLGFSNISIYPGGIFEWLCLQDIYGSSLFPTDGNENDLLKYK